MSTKLQATGEDYPEAALKHCDDARHLISGSRSDGAAYLAGYAVECALKTLVQVEEGSNRLIKSHKLNNLSAEALKLAAQPSSKTAKYIKNPVLLPSPGDARQIPRGGLAAKKRKRREKTGLLRLLRFFAAIHSVVHRAGQSVTTLNYGPPPTKWIEYLRYFPIGTIPARTAEQWVDEAERLYIEIIGVLKKDGEI